MANWCKDKCTHIYKDYYRTPYQTIEIDSTRFHLMQGLGLQYCHVCDFFTGSDDEKCGCCGYKLVSKFDKRYQRKYNKKLEKKGLNPEYHISLTFRELGYLTSLCQ